MANECNADHDNAFKISATTPSGEDFPGFDLRSTSSLPGEARRSGELPNSPPATARHTPRPTVKISEKEIGQRVLRIIALEDFASEDELDALVLGARPASQAAAMAFLTRRRSLLMCLL